jgi:hypothetical protein
LAIPVTGAGPAGTSAASSSARCARPAGTATP